MANVIPEDLLRGIYAYGYESPSAVQSRAITQICKGRDVIAQGKLSKSTSSPDDSAIRNRKDCDLLNFYSADDQYDTT